LIRFLRRAATDGARPEEGPLVRAARDGDRGAFGRLYTRYAPMVHGIILARVGQADADDLTQEVFATALAQLASLREPEAFGSWLAAIARNKAADHHRRSHETVELSEELAASDRGGMVSALGLLEKIHELPEAYRETLVLRFVEGMTGPEIAQRTGLAAASVRVNLHRGIRLLREKLDLRATDE
jgi:RNA polymerase sigma-70 factor, ECF subfamily